ncbi:MAG: HYR domain-containing protein, partial [Myxococcales bacterium]|nr:HYR domain-containing protein [Myxococcales bacterium]
FGRPPASVGASPGRRRTRPGATVSCDPASSAHFSLGGLGVGCTATDRAGNTAACSFVVNVNDTLPPTGTSANLPD